MVFYFSGTGNSKFAAEKIAAISGDETVSLNEISRSGEKPTFHAEKPLVFVSPVYAWKLPKIVERILSECSFTGDTRAYFVLTCGADTGAAAYHIEKLCRNKGWSFMGAAEIVMPENLAAIFPVPSDEQAKIMLDNATEVIERVAEVVKNGGIFEKRRVKAVDKAKSGVINSIFYRFFVKDDKYIATDKCIGCGKCAEVCPMNNIRLTENKPEWLHNCTLCMACYAYCPQAAIEYGKATEGKNRYRADKF